MTTVEMNTEIGDMTNTNDVELRAQAFSAAGARLDQVLVELRSVIVGQERVLERVLVGLLAGGHCLLEGVPGLGKTLTVSTLSKVLGGTFTRIQFTPDLIPSDIVGTRIYRPSTESFDVELGPVFANFVLADEINRAPAKVQSALLEVMGERQVSIGGVTHKVPTPFLVLATQNPIESEGVYPLPEAQRDRFLMRIPVDYPSGAEEHADRRPRFGRGRDTCSAARTRGRCGPAASRGVGDGRLPRLRTTRCVSCSRLGIPRSTTCASSTASSPTARAPARASASSPLAVRSRCCEAVRPCCRRTCTTSPTTCSTTVSCSRSTRSPMA